jgi:hypothetical protein
MRKFFCVLSVVIVWSFGIFAAHHAFRLKGAGPEQQLQPVHPPVVITCEQASRALLHMPAVRASRAISPPARLYYVAPTDDQASGDASRRRAWAADVLIGPDGGVHRVMLLERSGFETPSPGIQAAIWRAASLWKYAVTVIDGRAVPVCLSVVVDVEPKRMPSGIAPGPVWTFAPPAKTKIEGIGLSRQGACVAVATRSSVITFDADGRQLWEAPLLPLEEPVGGDWIVAVSPACDWAAVWTSSRVPGLQVRREDGTFVALDLGDRQSAGRFVRVASLDISPGGTLLAVGTDLAAAPDDLMTVTRSGQVIRRARVADGDPVVVEFTADGTHLLVTGWYTVGLLGLDLRWRWSPKGFARIFPDRNAAAFAALDVAAHGPPGGEVAFLDAEGRTRWTRRSWDPEIAMSPDGRVVAIAELPWPDRTLISDGPWQLSIVDGTGRVLAHRQIDAQVEPWIQGFSADGSCVVLREKHEPDWDLVGRNLRLDESWRIPDAWHGSQPPRFRNDSDLLLVVDRGTLHAYRMPSCRSGP